MINTADFDDDVWEPWFHLAFQRNVHEKAFGNKYDPARLHVSSAKSAGTESELRIIVFDSAFGILVRRKRTKGRYYFHPSSNSVAIEYYLAEALISEPVGYPEALSANLSLEQATAMGLKWHRRSLISSRDPTALLSEPVSLQQLQARVRFLESQLQSDKPHLQLYRFGATTLLISLISLVVWAVDGIGIPFHPLFAAGAIPVSIGVIVMALLTRPVEGSDGTRNSGTRTVPDVGTAGSSFRETGKS